MAEPPLPNKPIKTQRLILREARKFDLGAFHDLYQNIEVMRYWLACSIFNSLPKPVHERRASPHYYISQTETYLDNMVTSTYNGNLAFVIVLPPSSASAASSSTSAKSSSTSAATSSKLPILTTIDEGLVIGHAGLWVADRNELVFMIGQPYWGKGYMAEVLAALVPIFWEKGLETVYADVDPANVASLKVLRKSGFKQVGQNIFESYDGPGENLRMDLTKPEYEEEEEGEGEGAAGDSESGSDRTVKAVLEKDP